MIYFIQAGQNGPIKIGVSDKPQERLEALQTAHYEELELLGVIGGGEDKEKEIHLRFSQYRMMGEWFKPEGGLLDFVHEAVHEWSEIEQLQALVKYWRDRARKAESLLMAQRVDFTPPVESQTIESDLVRYALEEIDGKFIINRLAEQFAGQISKYKLAKLGQRWEARGWLTTPTHAADARKVTAELVALYYSQEVTR